MYRWVKYKKHFIIVSIVGIALFMQACGSKVTPEEPCNFVRNNSSQRVSWGGEVAKLMIHESVPSTYYEAIHNAANTWNEVIGREVLKIEVEGVAGEPSPSKDGFSIIYLLDEWDNENTREQARTYVRWRGSLIQEADVILNKENFNFSVLNTSVANAVDLESLLIHEFGHVLGLAHIDESGSVMNTFLQKGLIRREVSKLDIDSLSCEY